MQRIKKEKCFRHVIFLPDSEGVGWAREHGFDVDDDDDGGGRAGRDKYVIVRGDVNV